MSIPFFHEVLKQLGRKLNYDSVSNLYGNSFCKDAAKYIQEAYPLSVPSKIGSGFASLLDQAPIVKIHTSENNENTTKAIENDLGDLSWAEGVL